MQQENKTEKIPIKSKKELRQIYGISQTTLKRWCRDAKIDVTYLRRRILPATELKKLYDIFGTPGDIA